MAVWLVALALAGAVQTAEPIDEIVAVVEGAPITLWDVEVESELRSLEQRGAIPVNAPDEAERKQSLEQLINQTLALHAADRFRVGYPTEGEIEQELRVLQNLAVQPVDKQLAAAGIPESRLRLRVRAKLRIRRLIQERIREMVRVSDEEVRAYLKDHPSAATDATSLVREYLTTVRLQDRSRRFLQELRERSAVDILDPRYR